MRVATGLAIPILLSGCGSGNEALRASGGHQDFVAMQSISVEYGTAESDATVPVMVSGGVAAAGFVRGLTMGMVQGDIEYEPIEL